MCNDGSSGIYAALQLQGEIQKLRAVLIIGDR